MKKLCSILLILMLTFTSMLTGCANQSVSQDNDDNNSQTNEQAEILYYAITKDVKTLNPIFPTDTVSQGVISNIFDPLIQRDADGNIVPVIAAELPIISDDNKAITFKLKEGWKWHDGVELTADDIKFSMDLILNPEVNSPKQSSYSSIKSTEVIDKYTVKFNLDTVDSQIIEEFVDGNSGRFIVPKHLLENIDIKQLEQSDFSINPVGNGLFKFDEWNKAERIVLKRNEDYILEPAKLESIVYMITPSSSTSVLKLEAGEITITPIEPTEVERIKKDDKLAVATYQSSGFDCIQYNLQDTIFSDKNIRQAISYAIDINPIIDGIYSGAASPALSSYPRGLWAFNENTKQYNYDKEKAEKLLEESGWMLGNDGYRYKDGKILEFELSTNKGNESREKMVVYLQNVLTDVGIKAIPRVIESNTLWDDLDNGNFQAVIVGYSTGEYVVQRKYYSKGGVFNSGKYENPRMDELFDLIGTTFDKEKQKEYIYEIQDILAEDVPMTYLTNGYAYVGYNKNLKNTKFVDLRGWFDIEKWYIEQ